MTYIPSNERYSTMKYNRCGKSGLHLPAISLGMWHNFGGYDEYENGRSMVRHAFDLGITHFDLANNYGPPAGSAEENFGRILKSDFQRYRDELVISTKAGYYMWPGPYGDFGSKKYLISSLDQSLKRLGLDYVDIFYHHRPDPNTPIEETMSALDLIVRQGKALYIGLSNYNKQQMETAVMILNDLGTIVFSPLAQGLLTDKYISGIPSDSRAAGNSIFLKKESVTKEKIDKIRLLNDIAQKRGQTLAQMSLSWVLREGRVTSALIGASKTSQIDDCVKALDNPDFSSEELKSIDNILESPTL